MRNGVLAQIAELQELSHAELQERWRALYGAEPPTYNRALLIKRLAYRVQELAYGGPLCQGSCRLCLAVPGPP